MFLDPVFCNYIRAHISKITGPHKGNLRAEKIRNSVTQFFARLDFWCMLAPQW